MLVPPYPSQARAIENWDTTKTTNPVSLLCQHIKNYEELVKDLVTSKSTCTY